MKHPDLLDSAALPAIATRDYSAGIIVDNFAGGGGASTGIEAALGRDVDVAINHDDEAVAMHAANHPRTRHHCQSIWSIDPLDAVTLDGVPQPVFLAWFSPDCTHHSNARGGKPREKGIRDLAWVIIHWIDRLGPAFRPAQICIENVREFLGWGPLDEAGQRIKEREGETFDHFIALFRNRGYSVQWREVVACDHGAPTIRKRLVIKARCDGKPIEWAEPTYGPGRARPYRTAAECIDWSLPCPSIFLTKEEGRAIGVKRPLAEATLRRIARGIMRYVIDAAEPFIVDGHLITDISVKNGGEYRGSASPFITNLTHHGSDRNEPVDEPFKTITAANRGEKALIVPTIAPFVSYAQQGGRNRDPRDPMHTVTASPKDQNCLVAASMVQMGYGEREGQAPRTLDIASPLGTIVAGGCKHALVAAFLAQYNNDQRGPHPGHDVRDPLSTIATKGPHQGLAAAHLLSLKGSDRRDMPADGPAPAITAGGYHVAEVRAFLMKYYGNETEGHDLGAPMGTVTTKDRFGLVVVVIGGIEYAIVDIGMRMLTPPELAAAQGFPAGYILDPIVNGKPLTKTAQVRMIGNSVSPPMAEAEVRAMTGRPREARAAA